MLKFVKIKDPSLKLEFLSQFHPEKTAFICSDIKNKQFLEDNLLKKYNSLTGSSVLRANEFYQLLFTSLNKKWSLRSDAFVKQLLSQFLDSQKNTKYLIQSHSFFKWFQFCFAFFLQDSTGSLFKEWFYSNSQNLFPKEWLKLFEEFYKLLESQNILYESAIKVFLSNEIISFKAESFEKETLVVDLDFSMNLCEKEIFKELSRSKTVYILAPILQFNFLFEKKAYDFYSEWEKELNPKQIIHLKHGSAFEEDSPQAFEEGSSQVFKKNSPQAFEKNSSQVFEKGSSQAFEEDSSQAFEEDSSQVFKKDSSQAFEKNSPQAFEKGSSQVFEKDSPQAFEEDSSQVFEKGSSQVFEKSFSQASSFFKVENKTQIQEIQQAVSQVSQWLKRGIDPESIIIYTPNIEEDWFSLKYHLEKQSIPYRKTSRTSLIEFPEIKYLLSTLRFHLNLFDFQDLETFYFYKNSLRSFTKLKQRHFKVLNKDNIEKSFLKDKQRDSKKEVSGFDFVEWVFSLLSFDFSTKLGSSFLKILKKLLLKEQLSFYSWFFLLESELLCSDIELEEESSFGISCLSFNAFHSVKSSYVILLGLNEPAFVESNLVGEEVLSSLLYDLGFSLDLKIPREKEKKLLWFLQSSHHKEIYLSHYLYDWKGEIKGRAFISLFLQNFFLKKLDDLKEETPNQAGQLKEFPHSETPKHSIPDKLPENFNQLQSSHKETASSVKEDASLYEKRSYFRTFLKGKSEKQIQELEKSFFEKHSKFLHPALKSLSVSQLTTYADCPFKYAADKLFHIKELQVLQHELSPLIKGVTAHDLFQMILETHPQLDLSEKQKEDLIDKLLPDEEHFVYQEEQILLLKDYLILLINDFLLQEKQKREDYPFIKPLAFESKIKAFWNQKEGHLSSKGDYLFTGKIDRVDEYQGAYIVRDYKASLGQLTHISKWVEKYDIQLLFYAQALQQGVVEGLGAAEVLALFYSIYNEEFVAKGYVEKETGLDKLIKGSKSYYMKTREELMSAISACNKKTQEIVSQIEQGKFLPQPKNKKICQSCSYKRLCRVESNV